MFFGAVLQSVLQAILSEFLQFAKEKRQGANAQKVGTYAIESCIALHKKFNAAKKPQAYRASGKKVGERALEKA